MKNLNQNETKGETSRLGVEPVATKGKAAPKPRRHILLRLSLLAAAGGAFTGGGFSAAGGFNRGGGSQRKHRRLPS